MKNFSARFSRTMVWACLGFGFLTSGIGDAAEDYHRYGMSSGIIEYSISGVERGAAVVYFDRWGTREVKFTTSEKLRIGIQHLMQLADLDMTYLVDLDKNIGNKSVNNLWKSIMSLLTDPPPADWGEEMMRFLNGEKIGVAPVLGRECTVWKVTRTGTTFWLWNGIPLQTLVTVSAGKEIRTTAVKIFAGASIPEERFQLPRGVKFVDFNINDIVISHNLLPVSSRRKMDI